MHQQRAANSREDGALSQPDQMMWPEARGVLGLTTGVAEPDIAKTQALPLSVKTRSVKGVELGGVECDQVVVAEQCPDGAAAELTFLLQPHHEIEDADTVRPAVHVVTHEPQVTVSSRSAQLLVEQRLVFQQQVKLVQTPVNVTTNEGRHPFTLSMRTKSGLAYREPLPHFPPRPMFGTPQYTT